MTTPKAEPLNPVKREIHRMTITSYVHHERSGEQPVTIPLSFSGPLTKHEDVYSRRKVAGSDWEGLDFGWFSPEDVGLIIIESLVGRYYQVQPTSAELEEEAMWILELAHVDSLADPYLIPPRLFHKFIHSNPAKLRIRAKAGEINYRIIILPR